MNLDPNAEVTFICSSDKNDAAMVYNYSTPSDRDYNVYGRVMNPGIDNDKPLTNNIVEGALFRKLHRI